ncbi:hypothetical protein TrLO_g3628 [Triparma laevis f. longispina]|uniref:Uncharacterized protein n=1 Tax=Triparma laevis f. longispina TaxID=1714387 RepID=A0A9W7FR37_9STRA|nr:hypothetical protein TrLO_g3628 [Triparma laevis f. longispina]
MNSRTVWFTGCLLFLSFLILPHPSHAPRGSLIKSYSLYLLFHILSNIPAPLPGDFRSILTGFGGSTYLIVACLLYMGGGRDFDSPQQALLNKTIKFAEACSLLLLILCFALPSESTILVVFTFYMFYCLSACTVVYLEIRYNKKGPKDLRVCLGIAATFGMIDFLLPVIPFLGVDIGDFDLDFWSRLIDCIMYLPFMVYAVRGYDAQSAS